jgi:hypothetical protein
MFNLAVVNGRQPGGAAGIVNRVAADFKTMTAGEHQTEGVRGRPARTVPC